MVDPQAATKVNSPQVDSPASTAAHASPTAKLEPDELKVADVPLVTRSDQGENAQATKSHLGTLDNFKLLLAHYPLAFYFLAWVFGVLLAEIAPLSLLWATVLCSICFALAVGVASRVKRGSLRKAVAAFVSIIPVAYLYSFVTRPVDTDSLVEIAERQAKSVALQGVIVESAIWSPNPWHRETDPNSNAWVTKWRVRWDKLRDQNQWIEIVANSNLITVGRIDQLLPGDRIEVFGNLERIASPSNPGSPDFARIARSKNMFVVVSTDSSQQIRLLEATNGYPLSRMRGRAVRAIDQALHRSIVFDQAELAAALIFGQREQVDWESQQQLMATGTLHMLAISGMHVEIIAMTLLLVCQLMSVRRATVAVLVIAVCSFYAGLAGSNPPVIRALILIVAFTLARFYGFAPRLLNLLALAAIILTIQNVANLTNVGVQLSFLAVATIGIFNRTVKAARRDALSSLLLQHLPWWRRALASLGKQARDALEISFWVGMLTTPLIWHHFHVVSVVSIPLNVLLSFPLVLSLLFGLLTGIVYVVPWIGPWLALACGMVSGLCLQIIQTAVELAYKLPLGHLWLPSPPIWWSAVFYLTVVVWLAWTKAQRYRWMLGLALTLWLVVGVSMFCSGPRGYFGSQGSLSAEPNSRPLRCTFVDVGHGTSVVVELPDGRVWLYDAGHMGIPVRSHEVIANTLWCLPTARIDTLVISHADSDHYNATAGLLKRFKVGRVVSTKRFWQSTAREVAMVHNAVWNSGVQYETWNSETDLQNGAGQPELSLSVVHPPANFRSETDNADSLTLQIEFAGTRLLLPGDIEGSGLITLCEQPPRNCKILMAPHHGSLSHDPSPLLKWCQPATIVISGNQRAARAEVLARYASAEEVAVTFLHGAIQVRVDHDGRVSTYHWQERRWKKLDELKNPQY